MNGDSITLCVNTLNDPLLFEIQVSPLILVQDLKEKINYYRRVPVETMRILYKGKVLDSSSTIADYEIEDHDTIHVVPRLRHRPPHRCPLDFEAIIESITPQILRPPQSTQDFQRQMNNIKGNVARNMMYVSTVIKETTKLLEKSDEEMMEDLPQFSYLLKRTTKEINEQIEKLKRYSAIQNGEEVGAFYRPNSEEEVTFGFTQNNIRDHINIGIAQLFGGIFTTPTITYQFSPNSNTNNQQ